MACVAVMVDVGLLAVRQRPVANASFAHGRKDGVQLVDGGHEFGGCCFRWLRRTKVVRLSGMEKARERERERSGKKQKIHLRLNTLSEVNFPEFLERKNPKLAAILTL